MDRISRKMDEYIGKWNGIYGQDISENGWDLGAPINRKKRAWKRDTRENEGWVSGSLSN